MLLKGDMQRMIRMDGHLRLEGDESVVDLRMAILNLDQHSRKCPDPPTDTPIHLLLPDISIVVDKRKKRYEALLSVKYPGSGSSMHLSSRPES